MNRFHLFTLLFLCSLFSFSQNKNRKQFECLLVDAKNDSTSLVIYNFDKKERFNPFFLSDGFIAYKASGEKKLITPNDFKYAIIKDSLIGDFKFKSINKQLNKEKKPKYVFMNFIKEFSNSELKKGKINVYGILFKAHANYNERLVYIYIENNSGFKYINTKKERVKYLGKEGNNIFNSLKSRNKISFFTNNAKNPEFQKAE